MKNPILRNLFATFRILLGAALIWLALQGIDWSLLGARLSQVNAGWLAAAVLLVLLGLGLKVARWNFLLAQGGVKLKWKDLALAFFSGQAANILLPFRGGEAVRVGVAWGAGQSAHPAVVTSIVFEKYLDLLAFSAWVLLSLAAIPQIPAGTIKTGGLFLAGALTLLLLGVLFFGLQAWGWLLKRLPPRLAEARLTRWLGRAVEGIAAYRSPRVILAALTLTALIWLVMTATNLALFASFQIDPGALAAVFLVVMVYLGVMPALMPGNIGPFYFFAQLALQPFGIGLEAATSYAIVLHAIVTLPPLLIGAVCALPGVRRPRSVTRLEET